MKLSTGMKLGRVVKKLVPGTQDDGEGGGCAIGASLAARGIEVSRRSYREIDRETFHAAFESWPWLYKATNMPCKCKMSGHGTCYMGAITHLFDMHVFGAHDWTFDQLIAYVESVEPQDYTETADAEIDVAALLASMCETLPA